MPSPDWWADMGGTEAEYNIYRALYATGRSEPMDFTYQPNQPMGAEFTVSSPAVGLKVVPGYRPSRAKDELVKQQAGVRVEFIPENDAITSPDSALAQALGR